MNKLYAIEWKNKDTGIFEPCTFENEYGEIAVHLFIDKQKADEEFEEWLDNDQSSEYRLSEVKVVPV